MPASQSLIAGLCKCPGLAGTTLYFQSMYLYPAIRQGFTFTNGIKVTVGAK